MTVTDTLTRSAPPTTNATTPTTTAAPASVWNLELVVDELRRSREAQHKIRFRGNIRELPSRDALQAVLDDLCCALFPTHYGSPDLTDETIDYFVGARLSSASLVLREQVRRALAFNPDAVDNQALGSSTVQAQAHDIAQAFIASLPQLRALLVSDLHAAYSGDPAASSVSEILLCYPSMYAIICHRIAHRLYTLGVPFIARLISGIAHSKTGVDIHPAAQIGESFFIDHGTGVVIGQTTVIGQRVRLYQAVTLGAKRFSIDDNGALVKGEPRHPIVEDDVVIYAGATVLGRITIGHGSSIGGNVWLTHSVAPFSNVTQAQSQSRGV